MLKNIFFLAIILVSFSAGWLYGHVVSGPNSNFSTSETTIVSEKCTQRNESSSIFNKATDSNSDQERTRNIKSFDSNASQFLKELELFQNQEDEIKESIDGIGTDENFIQRMKISDVHNLDLSSTKQGSLIESENQTGQKIIIASFNDHNEKVIKRFFNDGRIERIEKFAPNGLDRVFSQNFQENGSPAERWNYFPDGSLLYSKFENNGAVTEIWKYTLDLKWIRIL